MLWTYSYWDNHFILKLKKIAILLIRKLSNEKTITTASACLVEIFCPASLYNRDQGNRYQTAADKR